MKVKAALIVDNLKIKQWQKLSLENALKKIDIVFILNCKNTSSKKKIFRNFFYYILNFFSLKNEFTKKRKLLLSNSKIIHFNSNYNGSWQTIPKNVIKELKSQNMKI